MDALFFRLICSDAMARGMDLEHVTTVINYDVPPYINTYIHRVGRTARAGKQGICYTLLRPEDVYHFKEMRRKADLSARVNNFKLSEQSDKKKPSGEQDPEDDPDVAVYQKALEALRNSLAEEKSRLKERTK
jgi:ATP-dependent RNA helicase DDX51/DBP6